MLSVLPSCEPGVQQKIKQAIYVTYIETCKGTDYIRPRPLQSWLEFADDKFTVNWSDGLQSPSDIGNAIDNL